MKSNQDMVSKMQDKISSLVKQRQDNMARQESQAQMLSGLETRERSFSMPGDLKQLKVRIDSSENIPKSCNETALPSRMTLNNRISNYQQNTNTSPRIGVQDNNRDPPERGRSPRGMSYTSPLENSCDNNKKPSYNNQGGSFQGRSRYDKAANMSKFSPHSSSVQNTSTSPRQNTSPRGYNNKSPRSMQNDRSPKSVHRDNHSNDRNRSNFQNDRKNNHSNERNRNFQNDRRDNYSRDQNSNKEFSNFRNDRRGNHSNDRNQTKEFSNFRNNITPHPTGGNSNAHQFRNNNSSRSPGYSVNTGSNHKQSVNSNGQFRNQRSPADNRNPNENRNVNFPQNKNTEYQTSQEKKSSSHFHSNMPLNSQQAGLMNTSQESHVNVSVPPPGYCPSQNIQNTISGPPLQQIQNNHMDRNSHKFGQQLNEPPQYRDPRMQIGGNQVDGCQMPLQPSVDIHFPPSSQGNAGITNPPLNSNQFANDFSSSTPGPTHGIHIKGSIQPPNFPAAREAAMISCQDSTLISNPGMSNIRTNQSMQFDRQNVHTEFGYQGQENVIQSHMMLNENPQLKRHMPSSIMHNIPEKIANLNQNEEQVNFYNPPKPVGFYRELNNSGNAPQYEPTKTESPEKDQLVNTLYTQCADLVSKESDKKTLENIFDILNIETCVGKSQPEALKKDEKQIDKPAMMKPKVKAQIKGKPNLMLKDKAKMPVKQKQKPSQLTSKNLNLKNRTQKPKAMDVQSASGDDGRFSPASSCSSDVFAQPNSNMKFEGRTLLKGSVAPRHIPKNLIPKYKGQKQIDPRKKFTKQTHPIDLPMPPFFIEFVATTRFTKKSDLKSPANKTMDDVKANPVSIKDTTGKPHSDTPTSDNVVSSSDNNNNVPTSVNIESIPPALDTSQPVDKQVVGIIDAFFKSLKSEERVAIAKSFTGEQLLPNQTTEPTSTTPTLDEHMVGHSQQYPQPGLIVGQCQLNPPLYGSQQDVHSTTHQPLYNISDSRSEDALDAECEKFIADARKAVDERLNTIQAQAQRTSVRSRSPRLVQSPTPRKQVNIPYEKVSLGRSRDPRRSKVHGIEYPSTSRRQSLSPPNLNNNRALILSGRKSRHRDRRNEHFRRSRSSSSSRSGSRCSSRSNSRSRQRKTNDWKEKEIVVSEVIRGGNVMSVERRQITRRRRGDIGNSYFMDSRDSRRLQSSSSHRRHRDGISSALQLVDDFQNNVASHRGMELQLSPRPYLEFPSSPDSHYRDSASRSRDSHRSPRERILL